MIFISIFLNNILFVYRVCGIKNWTHEKSSLKNKTKAFLMRTRKLYLETYKVSMKWKLVDNFFSLHDRRATDSFRKTSNHILVTMKEIVWLRLITKG